MHLLKRGLFLSWRGVAKGLASLALAFSLYSEPAALGQGGPTLQCDTFTAPWIQVNGANTGAAQYIDAGEPLNSPAGLGLAGAKTFASVVVTNGDLIYVVPSPFGARLGRLSAGKQWQLWTDSGWSNSPSLAPRAIENTVLRYGDPKLFAHPTASGGVIGVSNAKVHSGGLDFDFHNFRANFEFDGSKFVQWKKGVSYDPFYAKQLIPGRIGDPVDFAYDPATRTGIAVGGYGTDLAYDDAKLSAVRFDFNDINQKWRRWERDDNAGVVGHWLTDSDIQAGILNWMP